MYATARPWLPSVAHASRATPGCSASARWMAHDAPSTLNDGSPSRLDSSLTSTRSTPSSAAAAGASTSGVGA